MFLDVPIHYIKEKFQFFLNYNIKGLKATEKSLWWTQRRNASKLLKEFIQELEKKVIFQWFIIKIFVIISYIKLINF